MITGLKYGLKEFNNKNQSLIRKDGKYVYYLKDCVDHVEETEIDPEWFAGSWKVLAEEELYASYLVVSER